MEPRMVKVEGKSCEKVGLILFKYTLTSLPARLSLLFSFLCVAVQQRRKKGENLGPRLNMNVTIISNGLLCLTRMQFLRAEQLEGKLNKPSVLHWYCSKTTSDYFTLWLKKSSLLSYTIDCWNYNMGGINSYRKTSLIIVL